MTEMTGGQAIVQCLKQYGVNTVFGLPGLQLDAVFDALYEERESMRVLHTRHEQAAAYMAFGYAFSTGNVGVCLVVPGPGLMNAAAALSSAYAVNSKVLCIAGQIPSDAIDKGFGVLHEIPDQLGMTRSFTKWAARIDHPSETPNIVQEAFRQLHSHRPRPVELEMAQDIMALKADIELIDPLSTYDEPEIDEDLINEAAKLLGQAEFPLIFTGGGVFGAEKELYQLAETLQAPVLMSGNGRGVIDDRNYLAHTLLSGRQFLRDADVVFAIGTRFSMPQRMWGIDQTKIKMIRVDIDPEEVNRYGQPEIGITGDAQRVLGRLVKCIEKYNRPRKNRKDILNAAKKQSAELLSGFEPQASFSAVIRDELPEDGLFVSELTQVGYYASVGFPVYHPRTFLSSGYQGTLGFGFPAGLGAQVGNPDKKVISINGDGGFMYNVQELSTAVRHRIPLVAIIFNDNAFGNVKRIQKENYNGRMIASDLTNPDFVKLAESFGAAGIRAHTPGDLRNAIREGFTNKHVTLIEVPVGEMPGIWSVVLGRPPR